MKICPQIKHESPTVNQMTKEDRICYFNFRWRSSREFASHAGYRGGSGAVTSCRGWDSNTLPSASGTNALAHCATATAYIVRNREILHKQGVFSVYC